MHEMGLHASYLSLAGYCDMSDERDELIIIQALLNAVINDAERANKGNAGVDMFHNNLIGIGNRMQTLIEQMED